MTYIDKNGEKKRPYIIHRSSIGCYERTLAMLIEEYAGAFPTWLSPVQAKILPLSDKYNDYAEKVTKALKDKGIENVSVVAFNNTPLAEFQEPPLASVDINASELGYYAAKVLIEYLENNNVDDNHYIVDSKLIERESLR